MQLKSLEAFVAVAESASFSLAAQALHTVQSNITSHIKKLETELSCTLLTRLHPIQLTSAGMQLLHYAKQILHLHAQARAELIEGQLCHELPLRIGSLETTAAFRLPPIFHALLQQHPKLKFNLETQPTRALIDAVQQNRLDCAFVAHHCEVPEVFNLPIWQERLVLIAARHERIVMSPKDLQQLRFIAFRQGCSYRRMIEVFLQKQGVPASAMVEMGSLDGIMGCVSLGMGVSILPEAYVKQSRYCDALQMVSLKDEFAISYTYLIAAQPETWSSNLRLFIQSFQHHVQLVDDKSFESESLVSKSLVVKSLDLNKENLEKESSDKERREKESPDKERRDKERRDQKRLLTRPKLVV